VYGNADISGLARIFDNAKVFEKTFVSGCAHIFGDAIISGKSDICDFAMITDKAVIRNNEEWMFNSIAGDVTFFRCKDNSIKVVAYGNMIKSEVFTLDEFINAIPSFYDERKRKIYPILCQLAKAHMNK
jgi:hypothetical protein